MNQHVAHKWPGALLVGPGDDAAVFQMPGTVEVMKAIQSQGGIATVIGEITSDDQEVFRYDDRIVATLPNKPSKEILKSLGES